MSCLIKRMIKNKQMSKTCMSVHITKVFYNTNNLIQQKLSMGQCSLKMLMDCHLNVYTLPICH